MRPTIAGGCRDPARFGRHARPSAPISSPGKEGDRSARRASEQTGLVHRCCDLEAADQLPQHADLLAGLGKHTTSRVCVYLKRLGDIDLAVLEQVLRASYANLKAEDGNVKRV